MPQNLTENTASYPAAVSIPLGSEPRTIASLTPGFQALADRTGFINLRFLDKTGGTVTPTTPIVIAGAQGMHFSGVAKILTGGSFTADSGSSVTLSSGATVTIGASATVTGATTFSGNVALNGGNNTASSLTMSGSSNVVLNPRSVTRLVRTAWESVDTSWIPIGRGWQNAQVGTLLYIPIRVPNGATITFVEVSVIAAGGHAGLPSSMPTLKLWRMTYGSTTPTQIGGTATDASASTGTYQAEHKITLSGLSEVASANTEEFYLEVLAESGTNSLTGMQVLGASITYTSVGYED